MRFVSDKTATPEYKAAVEAVGKVKDLAGRVYAEVVADEAMSIWTENRGLSKSSASPIPRGRKGWIGRVWLDHVKTWKRGGKRVCTTFEPYGIGLDDLRQLVMYADRYELDVEINTWPAGHFPGSVLWIEIWEPGERDYRVPDAP